jgi:hypothetical protein
MIHLLDALVHAVETFKSALTFIILPKADETKGRAWETGLVVASLVTR